MRRIRNGPAPSIIAASSSSRGIVMKYWRSRNTLKALAKKCGTISGSHVPFQPSHVKITYVRQERHLERQDDRRDQDEEEDVLAGEPEPGEAVGHEDRRQHRADRAEERDPERVAQQPREVQLVPDRRVVVDERRERPRLLEGPPATLPLDRRRRRVGRVDERCSTRGPARSSIRCARRRRRSGPCRSGTPGPRTCPVCGAGRPDRRARRRDLRRAAGTRS